MQISCKRPEDNLRSLRAERCVSRKGSASLVGCIAGQAATSTSGLRCGSGGRKGEDTELMTLAWILLLGEGATGVLANGPLPEAEARAGRRPAPTDPSAACAG